MENELNAKEYSDQSKGSEKDITEALDRIIERAKEENEALKEMLKKIEQNKPGDS